MRISDWSSDVCSSDLCFSVGADRARRPVGALFHLSIFPAGSGGAKCAESGAALPADDADIGDRYLLAGGAVDDRRGRACLDIRRAAFRLHGLGEIYDPARLGAVFRSEEHTSEL